jgi:gluconolactonase
MKFKYVLCLSLLSIPTVAGTLITAASGTYYQATDWMPDNSFTQGVEGPAVDKQGRLYAVNITKPKVPTDPDANQKGNVGRVTDKNSPAIFIELPNGSMGNGIRFDSKGDMYIADYIHHNILRVDMKTKLLTVFSHQDKMNQPNDIAIMDNGILFASDPNWAESSGQLWKINTDGVTQLLEKEMGTTNGIEVSPDNKTLYVNESIQRTVWRYTLNDQGQVSDKTRFYQFDDHGLDGMRTDSKGNLYIARYGAGNITVLSPTGKLLRTVPLKGKYPTNVAFGGKDGKQVFVTMQKRGAIESFNSEFSGRAFNLH